MRRDLVPQNGSLPYLPSRPALPAVPQQVPYRRFLTPRQQRQLQPARDAAARVEGAADVTRVALMHMQLLEGQMARAIQNAPGGAELLRRPVRGLRHRRVRRGEGTRPRWR